MEINLERFRELWSKRSVGGWLLLILPFLGHIQTLQWLGIIPRAWPKQPDFLMIGLFVAGLLWLTAVLVWPRRAKESSLWLEFDASQSYDDRPLRIQNSGPQNLYNVVVKIPEDGSGFVSDSIGRLANDRSWVACTQNGRPQSHKRTAETIVTMILEGKETKIIPVLISFRGGQQKLQINTPIQDGIKFFVPDAKPSASQMLASEP